MRYEGLVPDVLTMSKSFGGGKSSISCFTTTKEIFEKSYGALTDSTIHSTTYNAFGEESITALEAINIAVEDNYPQKAKIIGERSKQLSAGALPFVEVEPNVIDEYLIATKEFTEKKIPFIIKRPMPNGGCEYWKMEDLEILV